MLLVICSSLNGSDVRLDELIELERQVLDVLLPLLFRALQVEGRIEPGDLRVHIDEALHHLLIQLNRSNDTL